MPAKTGVYPELAARLVPSALRGLCGAGALARESVRQQYTVGFQF